MRRLWGLRLRVCRIAEDHTDTPAIVDSSNSAVDSPTAAPRCTMAAYPNVSGVLQSKGHPIAGTGTGTGTGKPWEVCQYLRRHAGERQIDGARAGLAHVIRLYSDRGIYILEKAA